MLYEDKIDGYKLHVPITSFGLVHEVVSLPNLINELLYNDPESLIPVHVNIKSINQFEKSWRMAYRVFNTYKSLSKKQRNLIGLSAGQSLLNISEAYKSSSKLRWKLSESEWLAFNHQSYVNDKSNIQIQIEKFELTPQFYILISENNEDNQSLLKTLNSLNEQLYKNFTCILLSHNSSKKNLSKLELLIKKIGNESIAIAKNAQDLWLKEFNERINSNQWLMIIKPGETLPPHSLFNLTREINKTKKCGVIYADDAAQLDNLTFESPRFKPDFSIEHLRSTNFIGNALIINGRLFDNTGGLTSECLKHGAFDLLLRVIDANQNQSKLVHHLSQVLFYRLNNKLDRVHIEQELSWRLKSVTTHLSRNKIAADIKLNNKNCLRIKYKLSCPEPLVSIIIATKDAFHLIQQCISSILKNTSYRNYELLIIDHESKDQEVIKYFKEISKSSNIKIIKFQGAFNFSKMNNMATKYSNGEILCLLNNDTEIITNDWLNEMVSHLIQDKVGVVGAKLLFPNNLVQHGGDTVGPGGCANHLHSLIPKDDLGYCNRAIVAQELSAVTGACLVTWRKVYQDLGGFNEKRLKVAFNDVDYCLRVREAGYKVVWTPHAELYHHESMTRGKDTSLGKKWRAYKEVKYMRKKWGHLMRNDPFYNINLSYEHADFSLNSFPYVEKPWDQAEK